MFGKAHGFSAYLICSLRQLSGEGGLGLYPRKWSFLSDGLFLVEWLITQKAKLYPAKNLNFCIEGFPCVCPCMKGYINKATCRESQNVNLSALPFASHLSHRTCLACKENLRSMKQERSFASFICRTKLLMMNKGRMNVFVLSSETE